MLVSISFEAIEKRKVYQVEISFWKCVQVDWTEWPWGSFHPIGQPSGRHKIMAHKVKHLPRLILYRSVSQSSLVVRLSIDLAVLLRDDGRSHRNLSTALRRSSGLCGRGFRSCWCRVRHWCRCGWRSCRLRRWCRGTWSCWAPPVICRPSLTLVTTPPIPALPIGLSSRTAWVRPVRVPSLPPVPSTAAFKGLVAKLTALPAFNSLLKDWPLMSIALALGRPLDWVKMTPIPLSSFAGTRFVDLANGNSATSDAVASSTRECSSPLMLWNCSFHWRFAKSTKSKKQSWADCWSTGIIEPDHPNNVGVGSPSLWASPQQAQQTEEE